MSTRTHIICLLNPPPPTTCKMKTEVSVNIAPKDQDPATGEIKAEVIMTQQIHPEI